MAMEMPHGFPTWLLGAMVTLPVLAAYQTPSQL